MKQKNKITKTVKAEFKKLIDEFGYWSEQVKTYSEKFEYNTTCKLHSMAHAYINHNQDF